MQNNNLNTFRILYLIKGILALAGSLFFVLYACFGLFFQSAFESIPEQDVEMPFNPGNIFIIIGAIGFVIAIIIGILNIMASNYIKVVKKYNFIFAIAVINCLTGILGIILGIFTFIELGKPEVKALFEKPDELSTQ